jgi:hypothetical protein
VQQCGACNTVVEFNPNAPLPRVTSLARWLRRHARHVRSLTLEAARDADEVDEDVREAVGRGFCHDRHKLL